MAKIDRNDMGFPKVTQETDKSALYGIFNAFLMMGAIIVLIGLIYAAMVILTNKKAIAEELPNRKNVIVALGYSNYQICEAIRRAENSKSHPYGIMVKYEHTTPKQACLNTIKHLRRDYIAMGSHGDFIEFMGRKYSPPAKNPNWVRLVKYFLTNKAA